MSLLVSKPFVQGDTLTITIIPYDAYTLEIVDISSATELNVDIVQTIGGTPVLTKTLGDGVTKVDVDVDGETVKAAQVVISAAESALLLGNYFYELESIDTSSNVSTFRNKNTSPGQFTVCQDIVDNSA